MRAPASRDTPPLLGEGGGQIQRNSQHDGPVAALLRVTSKVPALLCGKLEPRALHEVAFLAIREEEELVTRRPETTSIKSHYTVFVTTVIHLAAVCLLLWASLSPLASELRVSRWIAFGRIALYLIHSFSAWNVHCSLSWARAQGHLRWERKTRRHRDTAMMIFNTGNALLLTICATEKQVEDPETWGGIGGERFWLWMWVGIICAEFLLLSPFLIAYVVRVVRFNKSTPQSDIIEKETASSTAGTTKSMGVRELVEYQGDVIEHLVAQNHCLSQRLLLLHTNH
uniref:Transmembrane protein 192 n=1 Tax=Petromyzon marinus TaxID=7757 RepID=A0AAJ7UGU8_PETMA|nr:transmembrane protein 192 isoform X2 [Petromyzon marinus]